LTVSLVAELEGNVVGHIAFSPVKIGDSDRGWLALGPIAVLPRFQRWGVGQTLVIEGLKTIRSLRARECVLIGDPAFYTRFGFRHDPALRMEGVPAEVLLFLPMCDDMPKGTVTHHPAFSLRKTQIASGASVPGDPEAR